MAREVVFDGTTTVKWRKGKVVNCSKCGETTLYGDIFEYDILPEDGETYCEDSLSIPEHVLVHEHDFLISRTKNGKGPDGDVFRTGLTKERRLISMSNSKDGIVSLVVEKFFGSID